VSRLRGWPWVVAALGGLAVGIAADAGDSTGTDIAAVLREHHVVLIGEVHRWSAEHRLLERAAIEGGATDVVVEFGNARHQALVDRYVSGADVSIDELARAWQTTTQGAVWDTSDYAAFYAAVREHNARHPTHVLRLVLGDPPFWPEATPPEEIDYWVLQRDLHFAHVVQREVVARDRRALVIAGVGHVLRRADGAPTLTNLLEGAACATDPRSAALGIDWCDELRTLPPLEDTYVILPMRPAEAAAAGLGHVPVGRLVGERVPGADAVLVVGE
jgi:hypothetical protein